MANFFRPQNWSDILAAATRGHAFNATRHGVKGEQIFVLSTVRGILSGHLDDFARDIIASNDRVRDAYRAPGGNRDNAFSPDDFVYVVTRDGNPLAAVTFAGAVRIASPRGMLPRYATALRRIVPALQQQAANTAAYRAADARALAAQAAEDADREAAREAFLAGARAAGSATADADNLAEVRRLARVAAQADRGAVQGARG